MLVEVAEGGGEGGAVGGIQGGESGRHGSRIRESGNRASVIEKVEIELQPGGGRQGVISDAR
jgi:hypothetical protein